MALSLPYNKGQQIRCRGVFKDQNGQPADPTTVTFKYVHLNTGAVVTYVYPAVQIVREALGAYHVDVILDKSGIWVWGFGGAGLVTTADEKEVIVRESYFP